MIEHITFSDQTLSRVQKAWYVYKRKHGATQSSTAKMLDMVQTGFGQYINGLVPLNVVFILRFCKLINKHPTELAPELKKFLPECIS